MGRHGFSATSLGQGNDLDKHLAHNPTPAVRPEPRINSKLSPSPDLEFISENPVVKAKEKTTISSSPELVPAAQVDAEDVEMRGARADSRETQGREDVNPATHARNVTPAANSQQGRNSHHTYNAYHVESVAQMMATTIAELEEMASGFGIEPSAREACLETRMLQRVALRTLQRAGKQD